MLMQQPEAPRQPRCLPAAAMKHLLLVYVSQKNCFYYLSNTNTPNTVLYYLLFQIVSDYLEIQIASSDDLYNDLALVQYTSIPDDAICIYCLRRTMLSVFPNSPLVAKRHYLYLNSQIVKYQISALNRVNSSIEFCQLHVQIWTGMPLSSTKLSCDFSSLSWDFVMMLSH